MVNFTNNINNEDFKDLVKRLTPKLRAISKKLDGRISFLSHEDLFQEALIYIMNMHKIGALADKTESYVLQGAYYHLQNFIRKINSKTGTISIDSFFSSCEDADEKLSIKDESSVSFLEDLNNRLLADELLNNGFTQKEKELLGFLKEGLTTREIGQRFGVSHVMIVRMTADLRSRCKKYLD